MVTVNGTPLDQATDIGYTFFLTKEDGTPYVPAAEDTDGLNSSEWYVIDIPIYHEDDQPGGANPGDTAVIHVYKDGSPLIVTSPPDGHITVGDSGSTDLIDLTAASPPVINSFTATPGIIIENESVTLSWDISDADSAEINQGIGTINPSGGSVQDAPSSATTYTLTATNTAGFVTHTVTVTVEETTQYDLSVAIVGQGSVTPHGGTYDEGTVVQLTAVADSGWAFSAWSGDLAGYTNPTNITVNADKTVTATFTQLPPVVNSFTATPDNITKGEFVTLAWDISGADSAEINQGIGAVMPSGGSVQDAPTSATTYTLTATNTAGFVTRSVTVRVEEKTQFDLAVAIVGQGGVTPSGGTYDEGTVVQLTAVADSGWAFSAWTGALAGSTNPTNITVDSDKTVTATFTQLPPVVNSFTATPDTITKGGFVTLAWDISGADSAEINQGIGTINPSGGSVQDAPTSTIIYTLTAENEAGSIGDSVSVNVVRGNSPPLVNAGSHQSIKEGAIFTLSATFSDADPDDTHVATIDWGDGTPIRAGEISEGGGFGTISATHIYHAIGQFSPTVCVTDENGATGCDSFTVTVFSRGRPSIIFLEAHFHENEDGFSYLNDPFRNTNEPAYADGAWTLSAGSKGGSLKVTLGGNDNRDILGMSGGWQRFFTLDNSTEVVLSFRYKLTQWSEYEPDELSQVLVSVNGNLYGDSPNDYVAQIAGNGWGGSKETTGWQRFQASLGTLEQGRHVLTVGGFNSKKTYSNEVTVILIDDVLVTGKHSDDWRPARYYSSDHLNSTDQTTRRTKGRWHHYRSFSNKGPYK